MIQLDYDSSTPAEQEPMIVLKGIKGLTSCLRKLDQLKNIETSVVERSVIVLSKLVRDAMQADIASGLKWQSSLTQTFTSKCGYRFEKSGTLVTSIIAPLSVLKSMRTGKNQGAAEVLGRHLDQRQIDVGEKANVVFAGKQAIPNTKGGVIQKTPRGTVPGTRLPGALVQPGGGGYTNRTGTVILIKEKYSRQSKVAFILKNSVTSGPKTINPAVVGMDVALRNFQRVFTQSIRKKIAEVGVF